MANYNEEFMVGPFCQLMTHKMRMKKKVLKYEPQVLWIFRRKTNKVQMKWETDLLDR